MIDRLWVREDGETKIVDGVRTFEKIECDGETEVIVDFQDGTSAIFDDVWAGS